MRCVWKDEIELIPTKHPYHCPDALAVGPGKLEIQSDKKKNMKPLRSNQYEKRKNKVLVDIANGNRPIQRWEDGRIIYEQGKSSLHVNLTFAVKD